MNPDLDRLIAAVYMLHAEAHGDSALRLCRREPCAGLTTHPDGLITGPAPVILLGEPR